MAINIESYLTEISADQVCGEDLEYDAAFMALEQEVQGKEEQIMGDSVIEAEPPNWKEVKKQSEELMKRTRDLRVCVHYIRSLLELEGISGLNDGLALLKATIDAFWDQVHPQLDPDDDNDPTERINILMTLCDFQAFIRPLQIVPLVESKALGRFCLRDIHIANGVISTGEDEDQDLPGMATIDAAFQECDAENLLETADSVKAILDNLNQMESVVTDKVGLDQAASFSEVRTILKEINTEVLSQVERLGLDQSGEPESEEAEPMAEDEKPVEKQVKPAGGPAGINSNQDVLKALNMISDYYKKNEPSSPIPIMLERVSRLVGKNFMEVLQDIAPNGVEQVEFLRGTSSNSEND